MSIIRTGRFLDFSGLLPYSETIRSVTAAAFWNNLLHELSLTQNLIEIAEQHARREGAKSITAITLEIGVLSGVIREAVEFAFEACTKGTLAEGALLEIIHVPGLGYCHECEQEFQMDSLIDTCPHCGGFALDIHQGQEMKLTEMEID